MYLSVLSEIKHPLISERNYYRILIIERLITIGKKTLNIKGMRISDVRQKEIIITVRDYTRKEITVHKISKEVQHLGITVHWRQKYQYTCKATSLGTCPCPLISISIAPLDE